jgi:hypothetical protein
LTKVSIFCIIVYRILHVVVFDVVHTKERKMGPLIRDKNLIVDTCSIEDIQNFLDMLDNRSRKFLQILYSRRANGQTSFSTMKRLLHCTYNELCGSISNLSGYFRKFEKNNNYSITIFNTDMIDSMYNGERIRSSRWTWCGPVRGLIFKDVNKKTNDNSILGGNMYKGPQVFFRRRRI